MPAPHAPQPLSLRATRSTLRGLGALSPRVLRLLAGRPVVVDGATLLPEAQLGIRFLAMAPGESFERLPLPEAREELEAEAWLFSASTHCPHVEERTIPGAAGTLRARLYDPAPGRDKDALVVWFHGGGFVLGSLETGDDICRFLARSSGAAVLSVDYRLAPEHPFPAGIEDAVAATRAALAQAADLGCRRVLVAGESAGGGLAAHVAQQVPGLAGQVLVSPWLDLVEETRSYDLFGEGYTLTREQLDWYRAHYLADPADAHAASPGRVADLTGLAPAVVVVLGFDPLRDEALDYADRLERAGVPVTRIVEPGLPHSAINATGASRRAREMIDEMGAVVRDLAAAR